ncbi:hypothetical protein VPH1254_0047 [Vibrio phage 1254]|nr:hypothetical protein SIPHO018v1_130003 [Vibrio phage 11E33.1]QZI92554.1 hypothetical protein SIPHO017v1_p0021 [Vibrio phage 19E33.1]QZI92835.1 hypothetical protein SIPHO016v1_p0056 [Vibrio phage 38E33.6a]QZI92961.1 hypothetical protein SIPHO015v1_p0023 [Vibrio phage 82E32.2]QZI93020.1 hypothetical protein SIPHO014v1_p0021 [Vibrio phage 82E32.3]QZI93067.1 hypothetical protein SIPHO013v1_p0006 [Vibrio phage 82E33.2]
MSKYMLSHKTPAKYARKMVVAWVLALTMAAAFVWLIALNIWVAVCSLVLDGSLLADITNLWLNIRIEALAAAYFGFWAGILTATPVYIVAHRQFRVVAAMVEREGQS